MTDVDAAELLEACRRGETLDLTGRGSRQVAAGLIRDLCLQGTTDIDPRGLRVRGATITGGLDLAGVTVKFPLRLEDCAFDAPIVVDGADLHQLVVTGATHLPGLLGNGVKIRRDLDLSGSRISGGHRTSASISKGSAVWLCESEIGGRLLCVGTVINAEAQRALQADRMRVGGAVRMIHRFTATGDLRMVGAHIEGSLDLSGVRLGSRSGLCVDLGDAVIGGSVFVLNSPDGHRAIIRGRIDMGGATIGGQLLIRDASIHPSHPTAVGVGYAQQHIGGTALLAPQLHVDGDLTVEGTTRVTGGIELSLSQLGRLTVHTGSALRNPGGVALNLTNAEVRSSLTVGAGVEVQGTIGLRGAHIRGSLRLTSAELSAPATDSLISAPAANIDGDVELRRLRATGGQLRFWRSSIGGWVDLTGASLHNPRGHTLSLHQSMVGGSVRLVDGFRSDGSVLLNRSTIEGRLDCTDGDFHCGTASRDNPGGHAIQAISATVRGGMYLGWRAVEPSVDFTNTTTTLLADDPQRWPSKIVVSGLRYDGFARIDAAGQGDVWHWKPRRDWLARQLEFDSGPYEQAAQVFRRHGYTREAEQLLMAQQANARRRQWPGRRLLSLFAGATIGHGYRPGRMLWMMVVLLAFVMLSVTFIGGQATLRAVDPRGNVYAVDGRLITVDPRPPGTDPPSAVTEDYAVVGPRPARADVCGDGQVRCFNPVLYAIDTVVPLIALQQRSTWYPNRFATGGQFMEVWLNIAAFLGWVFSSIFLLSFTRLARNL